MQVYTVSISWLFYLEKGLSHLACQDADHIPISETWAANSVCILGIKIVETCASEKSL